MPVVWGPQTLERKALTPSWWVEERREGRDRGTLSDNGSPGDGDEALRRGQETVENQRGWHPPPPAPQCRAEASLTRTEKEKEEDQDQARSASPDRCRGVSRKVLAYMDLRSGLLGRMQLFWRQRCSGFDG